MQNSVVITVPETATISVKLNTPLGFDSTLYTISDTEEVVIPITKSLGAKKEEIFQLVTHVIGDTIKYEELLAQKKGLLGMKKIYSPVEGKLSAINHETGEITIVMEKTATQTFRSPVEGTVTAIDIANRHITVSVPEGEEIEVESESDIVGGELSVIDVDYLQTDLTHIKDKIVLIETITPASASKFEALDALGILYVRGTHSATAPHAKLKKPSDFEKLAHSKKKKAVLLPKKGKVIVY